MKSWHVLFLVALLAVLPALSACQLFGASDREQQAYEEQLRIYKEYQEQLNQYYEQRKTYNEEVAEAYQQQLAEMYKTYQEQLNLQQEEQRKALEEALGKSE